MKTTPSGMRTLILSTLASVFLLTFSSPTFAQIRNPLIRVCTVNQGNFEVAPYGTNEIGLCRFGQAVIDSQSILSGLEGVTTSAANLILSDLIASDCAGVSASEFSLSSGQVLCVFGDGSMLSTEAVTAGLSNSDRLLLKKALLAR